MAAINADQFQEPNGTIRPFSGQRWRGELYTQHDGLSGNIFGGSVFFNSETPGFGLRAELPDDYGSTFLNAEYRKPDWDFFQSMIDNGTRSRLAVRRRQQLLPDLTARLEVGANQYSIPGDNNVARTITVTGDLRLSNIASIKGLSVAYVTDSEFVVEQETRFTPLGQPYQPLQILNRAVNALTVGYSGVWGGSPATGQFTYDLSAGYGIDGYGKPGPLASGVLAYTRGSFEARLRASYIQNIGRTGGTTAIYAASLVWFF